MSLHKKWAPSNSGHETIYASMKTIPYSKSKKHDRPHKSGTSLKHVKARHLRIYKMACKSPILMQSDTFIQKKYEIVK